MLERLADYERVPRILRLNVAGRPVEWVSWQDAVCLYARELVVWTLGDQILHIWGGYNRIEQTRTVVELNSIIACDGRVVAPNRNIPPLTNRALFGRDGNMCLYCGHTFRDCDLTRDHVVPKSRGGSDLWDNVIAACKRCNHRKGDLLLEEAGVELLALPYAPNFAEYLALTNSGRILGDQMDFLKSQFGKESRLRH
ncbi:MAG: HNH endonuclease [Gammaproteobacteria bacterium]|jgi:5-methylcytosine-specific restriction endonuclease McrA|nr:HNH endonuclease [Gammaproteobacteria bacterium]